jgi:hypothetical protein
VEAVATAAAELVVAETVAAAATAAAELVVAETVAAEMEGPVPICSGSLVIRPK